MNRNLKFIRRLGINLAIAGIVFTLVAVLPLNVFLPPSLKSGAELFNTWGFAYNPNVPLLSTDDWGTSVGQGATPTWDTSNPYVRFGTYGYAKLVVVLTYEDNTVEVIHSDYVQGLGYGYDVLTRRVQKNGKTIQAYRFVLEHHFRAAGGIADDYTVINEGNTEEWVDVPEDEASYPGQKRRIPLSEDDPDYVAPVYRARPGMNSFKESMSSSVAIKIGNAYLDTATKSTSHQIVVVADSSRVYDQTFTAEQVIDALVESKTPMGTIPLTIYVSIDGSVDYLQSGNYGYVETDEATYEGFQWDEGRHQDCHWSGYMVELEVDYDYIIETETQEQVDSKVHSPFNPRTCAQRNWWSLMVTWYFLGGVISACVFLVKQLNLRRHRFVIRI